MPQTDLLDSLIYTTRQGASFMLRRFGRVLPSGVYFINEDDPLVDFCFPKEDCPRASVEQQFAMVEEELRRRAGRGETCGVAMVTEIERGPSTALRVSDGERVMVMQAETRREAVALHYPLRRKLWWWVLGEPEEAEGLIVERVFEGDA